LADACGAVASCR